MKIFYSAVFDNNGVSSDTSKLRELQALGHTVVAYDYRRRGIVLERNPLVSTKRDDEIIKFCQNWNPDYIIFSKCNGVDIRVFEELKKIAPLCYWFADPYVTYDDEEFFLKTQVADFITCDKKNVHEKALTLNSRSYIVSDGFDRLLEKPRETQKSYNVSFIGNLYGERAEKINKITTHVDIVNGAYGEQHSKEVSASKINLNFCTSAGPSDRVFKVLGAGGFLLTDTWDDIEDYFTDGEDLVVFSDIDDLNNKISYYLENKSERDRIALNGHKKVQSYTRESWAKNTLALFESLSIEKTYKKPKETVLVAGPWIGEFGWELFCWQGYIRQMSKYYDRVVCISSRNAEFLYSDYCDTFVAYDPDNAGPRDSFHRQGVKLDGLFYNKLLKEAGLNSKEQSITIFPPRRLESAPMARPGQKQPLGLHFLQPEYLKHDKSQRDSNLILVHMRNREIRPNDNWGEKNWTEFVSKLSSDGLRVVAIGTKSESLSLDGAEDMRECSQDDLTSLLISAKCIIGESSGAMHLASLYGCPQMIWADWHTSHFTRDENFLRYTEYWNPFDTPVEFLDEHGANPKPEYIYERFINWEL